MAAGTDDDSNLMGKFFERIKGSGEGGPNKSDPDQKKVRFSIWYYLIAGMLMFAWFEGYTTNPQSETVSYSEFKQWVRDGRVENVVIAPEQITGSVKEDGKQARSFVVARVEDPELVSQLEQKGVKFSGYAENKWLGAMVSWLLPLGFFVFIWFFLIKRMSGGPQGVLSLGKARAKVYGEKM